MIEDSIRMVRNYKKKRGDLQYTENDVTCALMDLQGGLTVREAAAKYNIPSTSLHQRYKGRSASPRKIGRKKALHHVEELSIAQNLATLGDFGMVFSSIELKHFVKYFLDSHQRTVSLFNNNIPGTDWLRGFLERHSNLLSRVCQNISQKRAVVSKDVVKLYLDNLKQTLAGVPPQNIINYDETNLTDDPKEVLQIFRKRSLHAERTMNTTKSSTSIMFAITASGNVLQPYVVYKGEKLQDSCICEGPVEVLYNHTTSGWFDSDVFVDWFEKVAIRHCRNLPSNEPKVLIGDNLPSHINYRVVELCKANNIRLSFLPPKSTHFLQPLDVGVYGPLKKEWGKIITNWKEGAGKHLASFPKWSMPMLLMELMQAMELKWNPLAKASFRACGIYPFDSEHVLKKMRNEPPNHDKSSQSVSQDLLCYLKSKRETCVSPTSQKTVPAGRNVLLEELPASSGAIKKIAKSMKPRQFEDSSSEEEMDDSVGFEDSDSDTTDNMHQDLEKNNCMSFLDIKIKEEFHHENQNEEFVNKTTENFVIKTEPNNFLFVGSDQEASEYDVERQNIINNDQNKTNQLIQPQNNLKPHLDDASRNKCGPSSISTVSSNQELNESINFSSSSSAGQELNIKIKREFQTEKQNAELVNELDENIIIKVDPDTILFGDQETDGCEAEMQNKVINDEAKINELLQQSQLNLNLPLQDTSEDGCDPTGYTSDFKYEPGTEPESLHFMDDFYQSSSSINPLKVKQKVKKPRKKRKELICNHCEYKTIVTGNLKRHMKTHTNERDFHCNLCDHKARTRSNLKIHMITHTGKRDYHCNLCDYKATQNSALKFHMKIHTGERNFQCKLCNYKAKLNSTLQSHMKIHTGEKNFHCSLCDYKATQNSALKFHMKTHTGERNFHCTFCDYKAKLNNTLKVHMKIHTEKKVAPIVLDSGIKQ